MAAVCGIFGYYNFHVVRSRKDIVDCLITGLKRLEYRGYDSAGVAIDVEPLPLEDGAALSISATGARRAARR